MTAKRPPDYLALIGVGASLLLQFGMWVFWGGRIAEKVETQGKRLDAQDVAIASQIVASSAQRTDIAVLSTKLDNIKSVVDTVNGRLAGATAAPVDKPH